MPDIQESSAVCTGDMIRLTEGCCGCIRSVSEDTGDLIDGGISLGRGVAKYAGDEGITATGFPGYILSEEEGAVRPGIQDGCGVFTGIHIPDDMTESTGKDSACHERISGFQGGGTEEGTVAGEG